MENAAGQLLGYSIQLPRALCRLLQVGPGGHVGVEVLGDVSSYSSGGVVISEEDKSSTISNPLTNRSTDLWKTFYNWIIAIQENEIDPDKTKFILYCNIAGRKAFIDDFSSVRTSKDALEVIADVKEKMKDVAEESPIWKHFNFVINLHTNIFVEILQRFEFQLGKDAGIDDLLFEFQRLSLHESLVRSVMTEVLGWFQISVLEKIAEGKSAIISWKEYNEYVKSTYSRIRNRELIDFASKQLPDSKDISRIIKIRPIYIQQLELISLQEDEIVEAVSDYMIADINRNAWIEHEIIDEDSALDFENRLSSFWKNTRNDIKITQNSISEEQKGQLLLYRCKSRQEKINDIPPPDRTISGTYHAIADRKEIGWHPQWKKMIDDEGDNNGTNS